MMIDQAGTYPFAGRNVKRLGYGAMQLAGPGVFGPPRDPDAALAVLRAAIAAGVDHIDTSDFYGPHVTNRLIREALSPYPQDLLIVTKPNWPLGGRVAAEAGSHGAPYDYDQRVPVILFGAGIKAGRYDRAATPADIAPTLARVAGIKMSKAEGRVLSEGLR